MAVSSTISTTMTHSQAQGQHAQGLYNTRAAAWQAEPRWMSAGELEQRGLRVAALAAQQGAALAVLPALWGWSPVGIALGLAEDAPFGLEALRAQGVGPAELRAACREVAGAVLAGYCRAARESGLWLVGGSLPEIDAQGQLYHSTPVIAPDGRVMGWQQQTHLADAERGLELVAGDSLTVIETPVARLGLLLGADVRYPEVGRILGLMGANVLVHQGAWRSADASASRAEWMARLWREVQANQVFGLESDLAGGGYRGRAAVYAVCEMTDDKSGMLAQADADEGEALVVADLDFAALQAAVDHYPIYAMLNQEMYRRYLPGLYERQGE
jgi:omega-amidase